MDRLVTVAVLLLVLSVSSCGSCLAHSKHSSVAAKHSKHSHNVIASSSHGTGHRRRHHRRHHVVVAERHAYPANLFMLQPPGFTSIALPDQLARKLKKDFEDGTAGVYPATALVQAGLVSFDPLHGGIFWRRQPVKYLIMHSTESIVPQDAPHIINSWNSLGRRHAGAQYVVDRDGHIYETVDPDLATVHVNIFKTLPGINNDNSIGIEMVHAGKQQYTREQLRSVVRLVTYLLQRYQIDPANLITHRYAQRGDHTDPVAFDWDSFVAQVNKLRKHAIAEEMIAITQAGKNIPATETAAASAQKMTPADKTTHKDAQATSNTETASKAPASKTSGTPPSSGTAVSTEVHGGAASATSNTAPAHNSGAADAAVIPPAATIPAAPAPLRDVIPVDPPAAKTLLQAK